MDNYKNDICDRFVNCQNNACSNKIVTYDCNPADKHYWNKPALRKGEDPVYYNVMNGCWICNYTKIENENELLCNRQFFSGNILPPCNYINLMNTKLNIKKRNYY